MRQLLLFLLALGLTGGSVLAANDVHFVDGELRFWNRPLEIWGAQVPDWQRLVSEPKAIRDTLQVLADRGVNTVGITLQHPGGKGDLFAADGRPVDPTTARQFTQATSLIRDHAMACVISLFSSDRSCRLQSPEAYRRAVQEAVRLLPGKHTTVFIVGDLFGEGRWSAESPCRMDDLRQVIELCRLMKQTKQEVVVGVPAAVVHQYAKGEDAAFFYVADSPDVLATFITGPHTPGRELPKGVVRVNAYQCHRLADKAKSLDRFLEEVEARRLAVKAPLSATTAASAVEQLTVEEKAEGFVPLFNGHNLDGWTTLRSDWSTWSVEDGAIKCSGADGLWLRSRRRFGSFILRFEFKIVKNGNSGVFVWSPLEARSSRFGMEMQIMGVRKDKLDDDTTGAIYDVLPPSVTPDLRIGDWNNAEIMCRGSKVRFTLNGQVVQDVDADQVPKLQGRLRKGFIGLQDHASPVWFRRIRIKELDVR